VRIKRKKNVAYKNKGSHVKREEQQQDGVEFAEVVVKRSIRTLTSPSWFT
jgi:hypothetical protein